MDRVTRHCRLMLATAALGLAGSDRAARAQFDEVVRKPAQAPLIRLNDSTFNQWALGPGTTPASVQQRLDLLLKLRIDQLDQVCRLSDAQRKRLRLASQGDIKRLHDRLEEKRRTIVGVPLDRSKLNEILRDVQPLRVAVQADPFEE